MVAEWHRTNERTLFVDRKCACELVCVWKRLLQTATNDNDDENIHSNHSIIPIIFNPVSYTLVLSFMWAHSFVKHMNSIAFWGFLSQSIHFAVARTQTRISCTPCPVLSALIPVPFFYILLFHFTSFKFHRDFCFIFVCYALFSVIKLILLSEL